MLDPLAALLALGRQLLLFTALLTPLELLFPATPGQWPLRRGLGRDLGWAALGVLLVGPAAALILGLLAGLREALFPGPLAAALAAQPWGLQVVEILLAAELTSYLVHRAAHERPWLWRFHRVHHSSPQLDWVSTHRMHPLDSLLQLVPSNLVPVALGFPVESMLGVVLVQRLHTAWLHSNLRLPEGAWERHFAGPRFHRHHHAADLPAANFASMLPALDLAFGTLRLPGGEPACLGLGSGLGEGPAAGLSSAAGPRPATTAPAGAVARPAAAPAVAPGGSAGWGPALPGGPA